MKRFMHKDESDIDWVPFDIETTGFKASDEITTFTLQHDGVYQVWTNGIPEDEDSLNDDLEDASNLEINIHGCETEMNLLRGVDNYLSANVDKNNSVIVAYNGEKWKGGFDLPFVRSRCLLNGIDWIFSNYGYTDPLEIFGGREKARFNTTTPSVPSYNNTTKKELKSISEFIGIETNGTKSDIYHRLKDANPSEEKLENWAEVQNKDIPTRDVGDLVSIHQLLIRHRLPAEWEDCDPFDDSAHAVTCYEENNWLELILHNIADVEKTTHITEVMCEFAPKYEYKPKTL